MIDAFYIPTEPDEGLAMLCIDAEDDSTARVVFVHGRCHFARNCYKHRDPQGRQDEELLAAHDGLMLPPLAQWPEKVIIGKAARQITKLYMIAMREAVIAQKQDRSLAECFSEGPGLIGCDLFDNGIFLGVMDPLGNCTFGLFSDKSSLNAFERATLLRWGDSDGIKKLRARKPMLPRQSEAPSLQIGHNLGLALCAGLVLAEQYFCPR